MTYSDTLTDKRVVKRNILKGLVDAAQLDKQVKALPDVADQGEVVVYDTDGDDDFEDDIEE